MATQTATRSANGTVPVADERRLPDGVSGMLLIGKLRFVAQSKRSDKQLLLDVETVDQDGHVAITSVQGWMMEAGETPTFTTLGNLYAGGHLAKLVGHDVCVAISARAGTTRAGGAALYLTCEGVWPLGGPASLGEIGD